LSPEDVVMRDDDVAGALERGAVGAIFLAWMVFILNAVVLPVWARDGLVLGVVIALLVLGIAAATISALIAVGEGR
jgi:hypothetical protein